MEWNMICLKTKQNLALSYIFLFLTTRQGLCSKSELIDRDMPNYIDFLENFKTMVESTEHTSFRVYFIQILCKWALISNSLNASKCLINALISLKTLYIFNYCHAG